MTQEYTQDDKDILSAMGIAEDDSTINDESESEEEIEETQETETEEEISEEGTDESESEEEEEESEEASQEQKPKKKGVAKILAQRNEAREEAEKYKTESQMLKEELESLKAGGKGKSQEYMETFLKQQIAEQNEISEYFEENEELKPYKKAIKAFQKEEGLDFDRAVKLYLVDNAPELLLDKQTRNRQKAKVYNVPAQTPKSVKSGKADYSDAEFEKKIKSGEIQL